MYRISKTVKFEAAHRLTFHKGKCRNLHGHTWKVKVDVFSTKLVDNMLLDFGEIKAFILDNFDHKVLIYSEDTLMKTFMEQKDNDMKGCVLAVEPTAENLTAIIAEGILLIAESRYKGIPDTSLAVNIKLWESKDSFSELYVECDSTGVQ